MRIDNFATSKKPAVPLLRIRLVQQQRGLSNAVLSGNTALVALPD